MKIKPVFFAFMVLCSTTVYGQENIGALKKQLPLITDSLLYVDALNRLAILSYENDVDGTFYYTIKARNIAGRLRYAKGKADAANNLGIVYDMTGNLQLALRYYNDAYNRYSDLRDSSNIVQTTMNIASVYQELGKDQKAINTFKSAMAMGKRLTRDSIMSLVLANYLQEYPNNIPKNSIPVYIDKARKIAVKYKDIRVLLAIDQLTADYYIRNNKRDEGIASLQQTLNKAIHGNFYYLSLDMLIDLGDIFAPTDSAKAINYYKQGLTITEQKGFRIYTERITKKLYDFYITKKDNETAFYYSKKLLNLHDEQEKTDNVSGIDYIEYALKDQQLDSARIQSRFELWFLFLAVLVCIMTIIIIIVLWRNWKKSHRTESALRLQFEQSEATMEAMELLNNNYARLIKIVAHDLRNPISAICTIAAMIEPEETPSAEIKELVSLVQVSSKNCLELINELLQTNFDQQQNFKKEEIHIDELLQQCVNLLGFRAKDKNQELLLNSHTQVTIQGDNEKLWRVMNNLIVNAIKFSPEGSEININTSLVNNNILIEVKDMGVGIPGDIQNKVFDPFTTAKRAGTQGEQPFGLGLYISKQIIEAHQGKIWFDSENGNGTTFYVELPVEPILSDVAPPLLSNP
jgi:signal transduction histidine kinase